MPLPQLWIAATESGKPVTDLKKEDLRLWVGKDEQTISKLTFVAATPLVIGLVIDVSGSERRGWPGPVFGLAPAFFQSVLRPGDQAFLADFNDWGRLDAAPTGDISIVDARLEALKALRPYGGTALFDAIEAVSNLLNAGTDARHILVVVTDGIDNSSRHTLSQASEAATRSRTMLFFLSDRQERPSHLPLFGANEAWRTDEAMKRMAGTTGGLVLAARDSPSMSKALGTIALVAHDEYNLELQPFPGARENTEVRVECLRPGVEIISSRLH